MGDYKGPERCDPSALLPGSQRSLSRVSITALEASAPGWHSATIDKLQRYGKVRGVAPILGEDPSMGIVNEQQMYSGASVPVRRNAATSIVGRRDVQAEIEVPVKRRFVAGARVQHINTGKKLVIIEAKAGYTSRTKTPAHRVADKHGNAWVIPETQLKLL